MPSTALRHPVGRSFNQNFHCRKELEEVLTSTYPGKSVPNTTNHISLLREQLTEGNNCPVFRQSWSGFAKRRLADRLQIPAPFHVVMTFCVFYYHFIMVIKHRRVHREICLIHRARLTICRQQVGPCRLSCGAAKVTKPPAPQ